jgi:hypothetical protein
LAAAATLPLPTLTRGVVILGVILGMEGRKLPPRLNACADSTLPIEITATTARADRTHRVAKWAEVFFKERVFMASPPLTVANADGHAPFGRGRLLKTLGPDPIR